MVTTWALDLDGVVWTGSVPIPGADTAVDRLLAAGHDVVFVTNNSFATIAEQEAKLASFGVNAAGRVMNSSQAAASMVESGQRALLIGGPGVREALEERAVTVIDRFDPADVVPDVVVVGLDWDLSYDRLRGAVQAVLAGARLIATNHDSTYPTEHGLYPGAGALVAAIETAVGAPAIVAGKPNRPMADLVRARFGNEGIMVGDRPDTDGHFATELGYRFGLVLSGVTDDADRPVEPVPDEVAADLAELVDRLI